MLMAPNRKLVLIGVGLLLLVHRHDAFCQQPDVDSSSAARRFVQRYERTVRPLEIAVNKAWWAANISGKDEDFAAKEAAENKLNETLSDRQRFSELKRIKQGRIDDVLLARQIDVLHLTYLEKQVDPELLKRMSSKANAIEKKFNVFRAQVGDRSYSDSEVRRVLRESNDSALRRDVWEASKKVGAAVEQDLRELVFLRNEAASQLGFDNYHAMQLSLNEQDQGDVLALFDELDKLTREALRAGQGGDRPPFGGTVSGGGRRPASLAQPGPVLSGGAGRVRRRPRRAVRQRRHLANVQTVLRRHRVADRRCDRAGAICTKSRVKARTPFAPTSTAREMCACLPTSFPISIGWARCCTNWDTPSTAANTFRPSFPMYCGPTATF